MRLFVALEIPDPPRRDLRRRMDSVRDRLPRARWVDPDNVHLTLLFLGERAESDVPVLAAGLREAFARCPPLEMRLVGGGTFPPGRPARVAWVGVEAPEELMTLQADVTRAAVETLGVEPEERPYRAHATLARCPSPWRRESVEKFTNAFTGPIGQPFMADHGILFESRLSPKGSRYRAVETFPLRGGEEKE